MKIPRNRFKEGLRKQRLQIGLWSGLGSAVAAEVLSRSAFDWMTIDMEHAPNTLNDVVAQLQAMAPGDVSPIVRPPWNDFVIIKQLLDAGATSLLIPYVQNVEEARQAVAATRYPPKGIRGVAGGARGSLYGQYDDYLANAHKEIALVVQAETAEAVDVIADIAAVDGVDGVFVGPSDLSASMGHLGNPGHPEVQAKIRQALKGIKAARKAAGILSFNPDQALEYVTMGYDFVAVASDVTLLANGARSLAQKFEKAKAKG